MVGGPIDGVLAIHNAFRADMAGIDAAAAAAARGTPGLEANVERFRFFNEILSYHAEGEQEGVFPVLEEVAPLVAEAYAIDHRRLDDAFETLSAAVSAHDALETARATAAFKFHLDTHLAKEDVHMFRIIRERVSIEDQVKMVGTMSSRMPGSRVPEFNAWIYPLLDDDDRENFTRALQMLMPWEAFAPGIPLIQQATGDGFAELARRIPELANGRVSEPRP
jgi:hemerythrin-like domain-containing protein